ncbi:MAG: hypothetical protein C0501_20890 [Isosphaera sp.]|nr:hypothetical protein [Isosphaera sp.]
MAASPITLEEAADRLGISPEEFKRRLKTDTAFKVLVPIRDGATLRFKPEKVDELARELGAGSNTDNPVLPRGQAAPKAPDEPLLFDSSDDDVFSLTADEPGADPKKPPKTGDSSVRLETRDPKRPDRGRDDDTVQTEELPAEFGGGAVIKPGSSAKLSAPKSSGKLTSGDSGKKIGGSVTGDSSEFELSLDADSDDFELKLNPDPTSDEVDLGELPKDKPSGSGAGRRGGESGILSRTPNDSGRSLEKGKSGPTTPPPGSVDKDSDVDFELTLDSSAGVSGTRLGGPKSKKVTPDSDSEFELTLDDAGGSSLEEAALDAAGAKGDIFETDFEIPPMEDSGTGSSVALSSDPDLDVVVDDAPADSGDEVVLEEDEAPAPAARKKGKAKKPVAVEDEDEADVDLADVEEDESGSAASVLKGAKGRRRGDDDEDEDEAEVAAAAGAYRPVPWGPIPALFLLPALLFALVGGLMGYEMLQTMSGYQQPQKPTAPLVREIAKLFEMEPTGQ